MYEVDVKGPNIKFPSICPICLSPATDQAYLRKNDIVIRVSLPIPICHEHAKVFKQRDERNTRISLGVGGLAAAGGLILIVPLLLTLPEVASGWQMWCAGMVFVVGGILVALSIGLRYGSPIAQMTLRSRVPLAIREIDESISIKSYLTDFQRLASVRLMVKHQQYADQLFEINHIPENQP